MAAMEETMAGFSTSTNTGNDQPGGQHGVVKGKRTKRQRLHPPSAANATVAASTSSSSSAESPASSSTTKEDEDLANCLILLAQGRTSPEAGTAEESDAPAATCGGAETAQTLTSRRLAEAFAPAGSIEKAGGFYVYECKTCNKCFPSFQALGGHRASHKKPKLAATPANYKEGKKAGAPAEDGLQISMNCFSTSIVSTNNNTGMSACSSSNNNNKINKARVHECPICGSEFSSGQALGGHMRRHRPLSVAEPPEIKKEKNVILLDLNLPAPADDDQRQFPHSPAAAAVTVAFPFERKPSIVFYASTLVDCHY